MEWERIKFKQETQHLLLFIVGEVPDAALLYLSFKLTPVLKLTFVFLLSSKKPKASNHQCNTAPVPNTPITWTERHLVSL